jgi:glycosyltransferase involved in cell wall biosynthesis
MLLWISQVRHLVQKIKPDLLHGHFVTIYGFLAACSGFHPLVVSTWGSDVLIDPEKSIMKRRLVKYALKRADLITCDGRNLEVAIGELGGKAERTHIVYHGVDTKKFTPASNGNNILEERFGGSQLWVINIRGFKPIYDMETFIRAMPLVLKQIHSVKFIIAGEGERKDYFIKLSKRMNVFDSIEFVGLIPHDELPQYLASSDVYVSTSLSDSMALSTMEAMACGLAPVITDIGDNRRWIKDGENGFIVPIKDPEVLAERIIYLLKNPDIRKKFGERNRKIIEERNNCHKEMAKMDNIYKELVKGGI